MAVLMAGCVLAATAAVQAQSVREKAREVAKKNQDAVVWVTAIVKIEITAGGRSVGNPRETKMQALGTVIDPSGLTVVALSAIDPAPALNGQTVNMGGEMVKVAAKSEHSQVKINVGDQEIASKIVLKDPDLDLAFLVPEKADTKLGVTPLKLEKAPKLEILDELICLGRLPKSMEQAPAAAMSEVSGLVKKPRTFIMGGRTVGGVVLSLDGTVVGITATYRTDPANPAASSLVIVPAEDVLEVAKQALAKKDEPSTATSEPASTPASEPAKAAQ